MTKEEKIKEIQQLKYKIAELEKDLKNLKKYDEYVLMTTIIKGKVTIKLHPYKQKDNLTKNGWRLSNEDDLKEMSNYLKH